MIKGEFDLGLDSYKKSLTIAEKFGHKHLIASSLNNMGIIYDRKGELEPALENYEKSLRIREELGTKRAIAGSLNNIGRIYHEKGELDSAIEFFKKSLIMHEEVGNKPSIAGVLNNIGVIYLRKGALDSAIEYYKKSMEIREELGNTHDVAESLNNIGMVYQQKGELNQALDYFEKSLDMRREVGNKRNIAHSLSNIGKLYEEMGVLEVALDFFKQSLVILDELENKSDKATLLNNMGILFYHKGELSQALEYYEKSLAIRKGLDNNQKLAGSLYNTGELYQEMGKLELALDFLKQSLTIYKEIGNKLYQTYSLFRLIDVAIDLGEDEQARDYLTDLQLINQQEENKRVSLYSRLAEALILKNSKRRKNQTKSEKILEEILDEEIVDHHLTVKTLINLSEILLDELKSTGEEEILEEVEEKVDKLMEIAKEQQSHSLLAESYWLKAQLSLVQLEILEARNFMSKAQAIAEEKGLERLARKISSEHDQILEQLDQWEELIAKDASIAERVKVANLEELMGWMAKKREIKIDEKEDEPVMLLLVADSGLPIYSKQFDETKELEDMLISGFLTGINNFVREAFEVKGMIRRIMHDEYTISFNQVESILFCYVYEGQSYTAMKKLEKVITEVHESEVWSALEEVGKRGYGLNHGEKNQMEGMVGEIFLTN
jgi:tetratricopeptide (TPR) repeat protein